MKSNLGCQLPEPIKFSESGSFANFTFFNRLPAIIQQVINQNQFSANIVRELETLSDELFQGRVRELHDSGGDVAAWNDYLTPYLGEPWIELPFFLGEFYFYRRILEAIGYFEQSQPVDPFMATKQNSLERVLATEQQPLSHPKAVSREAKLRALCYASLFGNQDDLSQLAHLQTQAGNQPVSTLILDETSFLASQLAHQHHLRVDLIADNAGSELLRDLYLIDYLLSQQMAAVIYLHLKWHPTFVSDATVNDVTTTLEQLEQHPDPSFQSLAHRLQHWLECHQLQLRNDSFWTMPLFGWEMDQSLRDDLTQADWILLKGDANYRRLVGDCHWNGTESFETIVSYFPAPLAVMRILKSELIVGLQPKQLQTLQQQDPDWLVNGRWGILQVSH